MSPKGMAILVVCIIGGIIALLALGETAGSHWNTTASAVVPVSLFCVIFIVIIASVVHLMRG